MTLTDPGNLAASLMLRLKNEAELDMVAGGILLSPWIDLTLQHIIGHRCMRDDLLVSPPYMETVMVPMYVGNGRTTEPLISPIYADSLKGLPPQLVIYGDCEVMQDEAKIWIEKCHTYQVVVDQYVGRGEMHAFGVGGLLCDRKTENEVDTKILGFLLRLAARQ